ncbi:MAG: hypothetical protein NTY76_06215 [Candidatus Omnitrophica bacterium]|nr:hypothetical protein [Candidatus Omnitrophota bacterium]
MPIVIKKNKDLLLELLKYAADAENMMHSCCKCLAELTPNGKTRKSFHTFSESAKTNRDRLTKYFSDLGVTDYVLKNGCQTCKTDPEDFSILGAVNLGLELNKITIKLYKDAVRLIRDREDKEIFHDILNKKTAEKSALNNEKKFIANVEDRAGLIYSQCVASILSKAGE